MKIFLREWWVYDLVAGSLKFRTVVWSNCDFKPTFFSKEIEMKVKDLILKLQELDPEDRVVVVYSEGTVKVNRIVLANKKEEEYLVDSLYKLTEKRDRLIKDLKSLENKGN